MLVIHNWLISVLKEAVLSSNFEFIWLLALSKCSMIFLFKVTLRVDISTTITN